MGGCITPPQKKQKPPSKSPPSTKIPHEDQTAPLLAPSAPPLSPSPPISKYKRINSSQFLKQYRIEQNIGTVTRIQGPKYISNYTDGIGKVLRIVPGTMRGIGGRDAGRDGDVEARIAIYAEVLGLEVFEDQQSNLLILQEYCCGQYIHELANTQQYQQKCRSYLKQIYSLIQTFHSKGLILANISFRTFRQISEFQDKVTVVELNLSSTTQQSMGHAYRSQTITNPLTTSITLNKSMDWQAFGYIVQAVTTQKCPIFLQHKLEYVGVQGPIAVLLKGKKIKREQFDAFRFRQPSVAVILGYNFRVDILQLIKLRKRRSPHPTVYYPEHSLNMPRPSDQSLQRTQTSRVFERISSYIENITAECQQPFTMYCTYNDTLKKLKAVFLIKDGDKKMEELKETITFIK